MATLISPGVQINVTDESYYDSSAPGSVPLIVIATASNKVSPTGSGIAPWTLPEQAGALFHAASQRELIQAYGNPLFYSSGGTPLHGHELNEYGLHAAYQFLGLANSAYILRADIDTAQLRPSDTAPKGAPLGGTFWFNPSETAFGVFKSNGNAVAGAAWEPQPVRTFFGTQVDNLDVPLSSIGSNGEFGVVVSTTSNFLFEKIGGTWLKVGSTAWADAQDTVVTGTASNPTTTANDEFSINGTTVTLTGTTLAQAVIDINDATITDITAVASNNALRITNTAGGSITLANVTNTPLADFGLTVGSVKGVELFMSHDVQYPAGSVAGDVWVKGSPTNRGALWALKVYSSISGTWTDVPAPFYAYNSSTQDDSVANAGFGTGLAEGVVYVGYDVANGTMQLRRYGSDGTWSVLAYEASLTAPTSDPAEGTLWYSNDFQVDVMVSDGQHWKGYRNVYPATNPGGVFLAGSAPKVQSDGSALVANDLWIDTTALDDYPLMYRFDAVTMRWKLIDTTDQTSPFGIMFADARENSGKNLDVSDTYVEDSEAAADMLVSNFVDPDAPDPRTVPAGFLLFNSRFSTYNVKRWEPNYFSQDGIDAGTNYALTPYTVGDNSIEFPALETIGRWVTVSGNRANGSPLMGRRAQRAVITKAMGEALNASEDARSEMISINLIAAPGYPELIDEMVTLNSDQGEVSFIVGDSPARLEPDSNSLSKWASNAYGAASNGEDGLVTSNPYVAVYYPWGLSTNIDGSEIMVPPSTMVLRTMAYNDSVSYPWFAPAGTTRGLVSNATTVGYLDGEGEYRTVFLNQGQRDTLYSLRINPIALIQNRGLIVYGQKTRAPVASALDRVNVARLVNYLRSSLDRLMNPFLFEQNDEQTRDSAGSTVDRFLNGLVGLRALQDYAVQCNGDNNTPERIDRNELWVDIAIKPVKSVEFIYVPIRITNSGTELS